MLSVCIHWFSQCRAVLTHISFTKLWDYFFFFKKKGSSALGRISRNHCQYLSFNQFLPSQIHILSQVSNSFNSHKFHLKFSELRHSLLLSRRVSCRGLRRNPLSLWLEWLFICCICPATATGDASAGSIQQNNTFSLSSGALWSIRFTWSCIWGEVQARCCIE